MTARRLLPLLLIFSLIAAACGGSTSESATDGAESAPAEEAEETTTTEAPTTTEAETTTVAETEAPEETTAPADGDGGDGSAVNVVGQEIYEARCASCHGADGRGTRGPDLIGINESLPDKQEAIDQTINGGSGMPAFGARLSPEEIEATVDYIYATF